MGALAGCPADGLDLVAAAIPGVGDDISCDEPDAERASHIGGQDSDTITFNDAISACEKGGDSATHEMDPCIQQDPALGKQVGPRPSASADPALGKHAGGTSSFGPGCRNR